MRSKESVSFGKAIGRVLSKGGWEEDVHPRDQGGRFAESSGGSAIAEFPQHKDLHREMGHAAPQDSMEQARKEFGKKDIFNEAAFARYDVSPQYVDDYYMAMSLEETIAVAMLDTVGKTKNDIYQDIIKAKETVATTPITKDVNRDPKTGDYTAARKELHQKILDEMLAQGTSAPPGERPRALMTGGFPGAGKSSMLKSDAMRPLMEGVVLLDSDEIKAKLAKADGVQKLGALSESYHEESGDVLQKVFSQALEQRKNIVIDGTLKGQDKAIRMAKDLERIGYRTAAAYADLPMKKAMVRAVERFARGGRFVDPAYIASHDHKNIQTFGALKGIVDEWHHYDTDVPMGQPARHVGSGKKGQKSIGAGGGEVEKGKKDAKPAKWVAVNDGEDRTQDKILDALAKAKPPKKG